MSLNRLVCSSVVRKFLIAITGLCLIVFVITHLAGNLPLYFPEGTKFNEYAATLQSFGWLTIAAEIGLLAVFLIHILMTISMKRQSHAARPEGYKMYQSKGGPSKASFASRFMVVSGVVLLLFLILHIWQFRFGAGISQGYVVDINGEPTRDLYKLVFETFKNPLYVLIYCFSMVLLAFHLRHGFWSAFQSLGMRNPSLHNILYKASIFLAIIISAGFMGMPLWIYFMM